MGLGKSWLGSGQIDEKGSSPQMVKSRESLPNEQFALRMVNLDELATSVTNHDMKRFAGLKRLSWLNLYSIPISDEGVEHLCECDSLTMLDIHETHVTDKALNYLKLMPQLQGLNLNDTRMTESAITALESFPVLEQVTLGERILTPGGLPMVRRLRNLRMLKITSLHFSDADLRHLESLDRLRDLQLMRTNVTAAGAAALSKVLPKCRIRYGALASPAIIEPTDP